MATAQGARPSATSFALSTSMGHLISAFKRWFRSRGTEPGIPHTRALVLILLRRSGAKPMGVIAGALGIQKPNLTALIDSLEGEGLVRRTVDPADRRACIVELTPAGLRRCEESCGNYEDRLAMLFEFLSNAERKQMIEIIERVVNHADETMAEEERVEEARRAPRNASAPRPETRAKAKANKETTAKAATRPRARKAAPR